MLHRNGGVEWSGSHKVLVMEALSSSVLSSEFMDLNRKLKVHQRCMHFLCTKVRFRVDSLQQNYTVQM
jgi:hypothetical protein